MRNLPIVVITTVMMLILVGCNKGVTNESAPKTATHEHARTGYECDSQEAYDTVINIFNEHRDKFPMNNRYFNLTKLKYMRPDHVENDVKKSFCSATAILTPTVTKLGLEFLSKLNLDARWDQGEKFNKETQDYFSLVNAKSGVKRIMGTRTYLDYNVGFERDDKGDLIRDNDGNPIKQKPIQRTMENDIVGFELNPIELSLTYTVQSSKEGMLVELTFQD